MNKRSGFTIVELLVVIVVIGVLAAITIVSYSNVNRRAIVASMQSDLNNSAKLLKLFSVENGSLPTNNVCPNPGVGEICLKSNANNMFEYTRISDTNFLLIVKNSAVVDDYAITESSAPGVYSAPSPPSNLIAEVSGQTKIRLNWSASSAGAGLLITNYKVYRGTISGSETLIATIGNVLTFEDTGLATNTKYYYKISAVSNFPADSVLSSEVDATPVVSRSVVIDGSTDGFNGNWGGDFNDSTGDEYAYEPTSSFNLSDYHYGTVSSATLSWSYTSLSQDLGSYLHKYIIADSPRSTLVSYTENSTPTSYSGGNLATYVNLKLGVNCKVNWEADTGDYYNWWWGYQIGMSNPRLSITLAYSP